MVGQSTSSPTNYTYTFSQPVNDIVIAIAAMNKAENLTFVTNTNGNVTLSQVGSCGNFIINGNYITANPSVSYTDGFVKVHSCKSFTSFTFSGPSDGTGMLIALCSNSVTPSTAASTCDPCATVKAAATSLGDISNTTLSNKVYKVTNNISISGNVTLSNCEVIIEPNVTITVDANAILNIDKCHFYTCTGMWNGFNVLPTGHLIMYTTDPARTSLIEDAITAINFYFPTGTTTNNTINSFLSVRNAIFNRNKTSIKVDNLQSGINPLNNIYSFFMGGSLITSRKIPFTAGSLLWPTIDVVKKLTNASIASSSYIAPNSLASPYIDNNLYPDNVPEAYLKNGLQQKPDYGIVLKNIATTDKSVGIWLSRSVENETFDPVVETALEKSSNDYNVFDNLNIGIDANAASLLIRSCVFQKPPIGAKAIGINMYNGSKNTASIGQVPSFTTTPPIYQSNAFFDLPIAVNAVDYDNIVLSGAVMRSSRSTTVSSNNGNIGINLTSKGFSNLQIINNEFTNLNTGILITDNALNSVKAAGLIDITYNTLQATHPNIATLGTESFVNGIQFNGGTIAAGSTAYVPLNCTNNTLNKVSCGILVQGLKGKDYNISSNTINVVNSTTLANTASKFGIALFGGSAYKGGFVENNTITGSCITCNQSGIYLNAQLRTSIGCNITSSLTNGFRFVSANTNTNFWDNMMDPSNKFGFTLEGGGAIGIQGRLRNTPTSLDGRTCNNSWGAPVSYWQGLGHSMTNVISSTAANSQLIVNGNIWMNPNGSGLVTGGGPFLPYSTNASNTGSIVVGNDDLTSGRCKWVNPIKMLGRYGNTEEVDKVDEKIADGSIDIPLEDADQRLYVLKEQLYEKLKADENLVVANPIFQDFMQNNSWGSFDFIYYTAQYLAQGDVNSVDELLNYFPSDNVVDDNYWQYYKWVNEMQKNPEYKPLVEEVFAMANLCPAKHGTVVFAAQNLYMQLIGDVYNFENICESEPAARGSKKNNIERTVTNDKLNVKVQVYPNPSKGDINIKLPLLTNAKWQVIVTDMYGRNIINKQLSGYNTVLNIGTAKGLYFVNVVNSQTGQQVTNKIIVE